MWTIIKFDKKNLELLKLDFKKKLGSDPIIYSPKLFVQKYKKNKLIGKEFDLLGDYLFCFHKNFQNSSTINTLKYSRGLNEIASFIRKCKESENDKGYLTQGFFDIFENTEYKFTSGPFAEKIFKIVNMQKDSIKILLGNIKTTINKNSFLFKPI